MIMIARREGEVLELFSFPENTPRARNIEQQLRLMPD
jgi:hypothetical protein